MRSLVPFACLLLASIAVPARAQIAGEHVYEPVPPSNPFIGDSSLAGPGIGRDLRDIRQRIDRARDSGALSRGEARRLNREARGIGVLAERYGRDGLSPSERAELDARAHYLRDAVNRPRETRRGR